MDRDDRKKIEAIFEDRRTRRISAEMVKEGMFGIFIATFLLAPSMYYLEEAKKARNAHLADGASLLCRSAMEAAMYMFLIGSGDPDDVMVVKMNPPLTPKGKVKDVSFEWLRHKMAKEKVLTVKNLEALEAIQRHGNEKAHTMQILQRRLSKISRNPLDFNDIIHLKPAELDRDLRNAEAIWRKLARAMAERNQAALRGTKPSPKIPDRGRTAYWNPYGAPALPSLASHRAHRNG